MINKAVKMQLRKGNCVQKEMVIIPKTVKVKGSSQNKNPPFSYKIITELAQLSPNLCKMKLKKFVS